MHFAFPFRSRCFPLGPLLLASVWVSVGAQPAPLPADPATASDRHELVSPYRLFLQPTPPVAGIKVMPEWSPHRALLLTLPPFTIAPAPEEMKFFADIIRAAQDLVPVYIFTDDTDANSSAALRRTFRNLGLSAGSIDAIQFFDTEVSSWWIRDFAPIVATGPDGAPVFIDPIYTKSFYDFWRQQTFRFLRDPDQPVQEFSHRLYASHPFSRADRFPSELARTLRQESTRPIRLVRPPVFLEGGDFAYRGDGVLFTSQQTLFYNGGDEDTLTAQFKTYFGVSEVHYLRVLPRNRVEHLDYVLKFTDENTVLVGLPVSASASTDFQRRVSRQVEEVLRYNETYLKLNFPKLRIIPVPFLPASRDSEAEFLNNSRETLYRRLAADLQLLRGDEPEGAPLDASVIRRIESKITADTGVNDTGSAANLARVIEHYYQTSLADLRSVYTDRQFYYRSYLNSLFLHSPDGRERFLLPRFRPLDATEAAALPAIEAEVEAAYRQARPKADVVWIDSDYFAARNGVIHCLTQVLPRLP